MIWPFKRTVAPCLSTFIMAGADAGAETLARAMTIIALAKMNGLDPQAYLADVLDRIHDHNINRLDELLVPRPPRLKAASLIFASRFSSSRPMPPCRPICATS